MKKLKPQDRLTSAKAALDSERFHEAADACREVLASDPNSYMALVLLAAALRDDPEAAVVLERAIAIKPSAPLAHRGLVKYHTNHPERDPSGFMRTHLRIYELKDIDRTKMIDRIYEEAVRFGALDECGRIVFGLLEKEDDVGRAECTATLVKILSRPTPTGLDGDLSLFEKLADEIGERNFPNLMAIKYFNCLLQCKSLDAAFNKYLDVEEFQNNIILTEKICHVILKKKILERDEFKFDSKKIQAAVDRMLAVDPGHRLGPSCKALMFLLDDAPLNAYLVLSANFKPAKGEDTVVSLLRALCCLELNRWNEAEIITRPLIEDKDVDCAKVAQRILFTSLCSQDNSTKCAEGIELAKTLDPPYAMAEEVARFNAFLALQQFAAAQKCLEAVSDTLYYTYLNAILHERLNKIDEAMLMLERGSNNYLNLLLLGIFYIKHQSDYKKAFTPLLQSAKLNPYKFMTFHYLGNLYEYYEKNNEKAKKCYTRTLELNPECLIAAKSLSKIYMETKDWEANYALLQSIINSFAHINKHECQWAWLQLGLHHIGRDEWDDAIVNLRTYMRLNSSDPAAWMILADSYYHRGSYTSALKCYQKAIEIDPNKKHCSVQIGTIQCLLRQYDEALQTFETVSDDYILPGLKGLAEVKLCMAKDVFSQSLYRECREYAQKSIDTACDAILLQSELICLWKILYNAILTIAKLPQKYKYLYFNPSFTTNNTKDKNKFLDQEIYKVAIDCIKIVINQTTNSKDHLYNDLAFVYYNLYEYSKSEIYIQEAYSIIERCIEKEKERWQHWNLLGVISSSRAISKYDVAQHAFIKALELDPTNSVLWSNLGVFYCILGNNILANQSFKKAQESNPTYINSWIGQALIAEVVNENEVIDLFRHASQLGFHLDSSSKYGYWVASTLCSQDDNSLSSKHLKGSTHAILSACDLMSINCEFEEKNAWNLNVYGILLEKIGRYKCAIKQFKTALENVERAHRDKVLSNLARLYFKTSDYESTIETLSQISDFNINSASLLALAYFKMDQFEDSYETYRKTIQSLANDEAEKIQFLIGMACVLIQNDEAENGKIILLQVINLNYETPSITGLITLCALGLYNSDPNLAHVILNELKKIKNIPKYILIVLEAYLLLKYSNQSEAIKFVSKIIHKFPTNPLLWVLLSKLSAGNITLTRIGTAKSITFSNFIDFKMLLPLACISELLAGDQKKGLNLAQKALFLDPTNSKNWAMLIFAIQRDSTLNKKMNPWIGRAASHLASNFTLDDPMKSWVSKINKCF